MLVKLKKPQTASLHELTPEVVEEWDEPEEMMCGKISSVIGDIEWSQREIVYDCGPVNELCGKLKGYEFRFEICFEPWPFNRVRIDGSTHVNQEQDVLRIAKKLNMAVLDVQTGRCLI